MLQSLLPGIIHVTNLLSNYLSAVSGAETKYKSCRARKENTVWLGQFFYSAYNYCIYSGGGGSRGVFHL